jgi:hypothetical protein
MLGNYRAAYHLVATRVVLSSIELVSYHVKMSRHYTKLLPLPHHKFVCPHAVISRWIKLKCRKLERPSFLTKFITHFRKNYQWVQSSNGGKVVIMTIAKAYCLPIRNKGRLRKERR